MSTVKKTTIYILVLALAITMSIGVQPSQAAAAAKPKLSKVTSSSIKVKWSKKKKAVRYEVAYKIKGKKAWKYKKTKKTSVTIKGLKAGKTYKVKVRAKKRLKNGKWTKCQSAKTLLIEQDMLQQVNKERKKRGIAPLKLYATINKTAAAKSKDMKKTKVFSHYSKNLGGFKDQYNKAGLLYVAGGENIAFNYKDVTSVMKAWMKSKGHKANILDKTYTHLGVGEYKKYWTQQFAKDAWDPARQVCPTCGKKEIKYVDNGRDGAGKLLYVGRCQSCSQYMLKCPECDQGIYLVHGVNEDGDFLIEKTSCNVCGAKIDID